MIELRPYQRQLQADIYAQWQSGHRNVLAVAPTGSGKTVVIGDTVTQLNAPTAVIAHRQELVSQLSLALARVGTPHSIMAPQDVVKFTVAQHMREIGTSSYNAGSNVVVVGVDTLMRRAEKLARWCNTVRVWVIDEGHHVLLTNKWGKATQLFPNAWGLGVTATPERADGKGLGAHAAGVFHTMVEAPDMRWHINNGYLTDYRIFSFPQVVDWGQARITAQGDYNMQDLGRILEESPIIGDVVEQYLKFAPGKIGVTFVPTVETAIKIANAFRSRGVPAEAISAKTPSRVRAEMIERLRCGELKQLVNVDLFGEGFDLPAIECVSMARKTESFAVFAQQFGRALRLMEGKDRAIIFDHVGNVVRFDGPPDKPRVWSLDGASKRARKTNDAVPMTTCLNPECFAPYERYYPKCPFCGYKPEPVARTQPEFVDGDMTELSPEALAALRGEVAAVDMDPINYRDHLHDKGVPQVGIPKLIRAHMARQDAQKHLREQIGWWAAWQRAHGRDDAESYRRFYHAFGVDVMTACTLKPDDANALATKINDHIAELSNDVKRVG